MPTCSNGHEVRAGSAFCGICGGDMRATCMNGHLNDPDTMFCETCGTALPGVDDPQSQDESTPLLVVPTTSTSDNVERLETGSLPIPKFEQQNHFDETIAQTRVQNATIHRCSKCAKSFGPEVNFCPSCGGAIDVPSDEQSSNPKAFVKRPTSEQQSEALAKLDSDGRNHDGWGAISLDESTVTTVSSKDSLVADSTGEVAGEQGNGNLDKGHQLPRRRSLLGIGAVALVIIIAVASFVLFTRHPSTPSTTTMVIPAVTTNKATIINTSVFDTIGVTSRVTPVVAPTILRGQPALTGISSTGSTLPEVLWIGAEYCPFCAAQRWSTIVALSRFGTWTGLGDTASSSTDVYPNTPTFTFRNATFTSPYLVFTGVEQFSNVTDPSTGYYYPLMTPTAVETAEFDRYDTSNYIPGMNPAAKGGIPFMSIGNKFLVSGTSYTPAILQGLTRIHIAADLNNPANSVTQAIITSANYLTATFCVLTTEHPGNVCSSAGVSAARKAMGL